MERNRRNLLKSGRTWKEIAILSYSGQSTGARSWSHQAGMPARRDGGTTARTGLRTEAPPSLRRMPQVGRC